MDDNERVLRAVLDDESHPEVTAAARHAAQRDIAAIRRGMTLLAADAERPRPSRRLSPRWLAVAAGVAVLAAAVVLVPSLTRDEPTPANGEAGPAIGMPAPSLSLRQRAATAERVVVGIVATVDRGHLDGQVQGETGDGYVLAAIHVEEAIKGPGGDVVAFGYDLGGAVVTSEGSTKPWHVGDRVLLFLIPDIGTVSASLKPAHLQVAEGEAGRYIVDGNTLVGADFTLEDVRSAAR